MKRLPFVFRAPALLKALCTGQPVLRLAAAFAMEYDDDFGADLPTNDTRLGTASRRGLRRSAGALRQSRRGLHWRSTFTASGSSNINARAA